jgi:hypothetical protein
LCRKGVGGLVAVDSLAPPDSWWPRSSITTASRWPIRAPRSETGRGGIQDRRVLDVLLEMLQQSGPDLRIASHRRAGGVCHPGAPAPARNGHHALGRTNPRQGRASVREGSQGSPVRPTRRSRSAEGYLRSWMRSSVVLAPTMTPADA